jgi:NTP pyrophosphatase (non-canonical NTP hydrolase)
MGIMMKKENLKTHLRDLNSNMEQVIDTKKYVEFVRQTTSPASSDFAKLLVRLTELEAEGASVTHLVTAAFGMSAEAGEFTEVVKKMILQGKPYNDDNLFKLRRELGDLVWYMAQACIALNMSFDEVIQMNFEKLSARYPDGTFDVERSENRKEGDV